MTVRELLARIDAVELTEWQAFERLNGPLGGERDDLHAALIAATVVNALSGKKGRRAKVADFLPKWDRGAEPDPNELLAKAEAINRAMGGGDLGYDHHPHNSDDGG
jgi:hypothetical protein